MAGAGKSFCTMRALLTGGVIILMGLLFSVVLHLLFWLALLLNSFVFAALGVGLATIIKSHTDQFLLNSFVIMPITFSNGTFFPVVG